MTTSDLDVDKEEFYQRLYSTFNNKHTNTYLLPREKYNQMIEQIKAAKCEDARKTPADYRRLKRYEVVNTPDGERLLTRLLPGEKTRQMLVSLDEMYDIIREYHLKLNHGGRSRMMIELKHKYRNVTTESVLVYLSMCRICKNKPIKRRKIIKTTTEQNLSEIDPDNTAIINTQNTSIEFENEDPLYENSIEMESQEKIENVSEKSQRSHPELYSRGQVDILSVTNETSEEYKCLLVYRNFVTKFIHLKPLKSISMEDMIDALLDIFLVFGAPNILQSKNGMAVVKPICRRISQLCPEMKVVASGSSFTDKYFKGKSNEDILKQLNSHLLKSQSTKWEHCVKFVQHTLNTTFHEVLCRTPNEMVFGVNPNKGIATFMSRNEYEDLITEEDLKDVLNQKASPQQSIPKQLKLEETLIMPSSFIKLEAELLNDTEDELDD